jgi:hypothetical protein
LTGKRGGTEEECSVAFRACLHDLRLRNEVRIRNGFLRFARLAHIGEVPLGGRQRLVLKLCHERIQRNAGNVAPARPSLTQLVQLHGKLRPCSLSKGLKITQKMLVWVPVAVWEEQVVRSGTEALAACVDGAGEPLADFDRSGLVLLAIYSQGRAGQITLATAVCLMVSRHASNEEVEQEALLGVGGAVEHGEFVIRVGDDLLFVVCRLLVLLK